MYSIHPLNITNLAVALPMTGSALLPMYWSYLSETGRRITYVTSLEFYIISSVLAAVAKSTAQRITLRAISGVTGSTVTATGAAVARDIWEIKEKGHAMSIYYVGFLMGPTLGPVIGGLLAQRWGWRAPQWFLVTYGSLTFIVKLFSTAETMRKSV